jgi:hypothetical protein
MTLPPTSPEQLTDAEVGAVSAFVQARGFAAAAAALRTSRSGIASLIGRRARRGTVALVRAYLPTLVVASSARCSRVGLAPVRERPAVAFQGEARRPRGDDPMRKIPPKPRLFKARSAITVEPLSISQLTAEPTIGLNASRYLEACRSHAAHLRPARVGKLVVTTLDAWERLLERLAATGAGDPFPEPANDRTALAVPSDVDGVLARLGLRRKVAK